MNKQQFIDALNAAGVELKQRVFEDTVIAETINLLTLGFVRRVSSTGKAQYILTEDNKELIINVTQFRDNDTYKIIKRTATIEYKSMKPGQYFIIGL